MYIIIFMSECIFCKVANRDIPNHTVYEDDSVLAFLDIFPHAKGHTVVILKEHGETILDYSEETVVLLMVGVRRAMARIDAVLSPEGYNVGWNQGDIGGQTVKHLHVHIMPRYSGDGGKSMHAVVDHPEGDVAELAKLFNS